MEIENLVNIKSFDVSQNIEIINYLISRFQQHSKEIIKINNPNYKNKFNLLIGLNTKLKNVSDAIILAGHIDTVTANEEQYKTNPYVATKIDDNIYGLGIIDMKCFFSSILDNIEELCKLTKPIIVAITCDEETKMLGIKEIINVLTEKNIKPLVSIIGEPTSSKIATLSKSCFEYQIVVNGKSCHSSMPKNGINSIYIISKIVNYIEKLSKKYENNSLSVGKISGGEKANIVPFFSSINFDIRSESLKIQTKCINKLNKKLLKLKQRYKGCDISLFELLSIPALEQKNSNLIKNIISKFNIDEIEFLGGCEAGYLQNFAGDAFLFGAGDLNLAHKPNEYLNIDNYNKYNELLVEILKYICNQ